MTHLYSVIAVNIKTGARRSLDHGKTEKNAEAVVNMAVMRRGVSEEFYVIEVEKSGEKA